MSVISNSKNVVFFLRAGRGVVFHLPPVVCIDAFRQSKASGSVSPNAFARIENPEASARETIAFQPCRALNSLTIP